MKNENNFLITYGLHSFVGHVTNGDKGIFTICARAGQKMVRHATALISECYGESAAIQLV